MQVTYIFNLMLLFCFHFYVYAMASQGMQLNIR